MVSPHRLSSLALALIFVATLKAEKPFDFDSTPGKLPKEVVPQEYAIRIVPDVKKLTFTGSESITIKVRQPVRQLMLNSADIKITRIKVNSYPVIQ